MFQKKYLPIYGIFATLSAFSFLLLSQPADGSLKKTYTSFDCFCTDLFRESITSNTINLHYTLANPASYGIKDYKVSLGSIGKKSHERSLLELENANHILSGFSREQLSVPEQMTYDVLSDFINAELSGSAYYYYDEPLRSSTGTQAELPILLAEYTFRNKKDVTDYLELLSGLDTYFEGICTFEQEKSEAGLFMSGFAAKNIIAQCEQFLNSKDDHYLVNTFATRIDAAGFLTSEQKDAYKAKNSQIFTEHVLPAYEHLKNCMNELSGTGNNEKGLCHLPDGKNYYTLVIRSCTGTSDSIPELEALVKNRRDSDLSGIGALLKKNPSLAVASESYDLSDSDPTAILNHLKDVITEDFPAPVETTFTVKYVDDALSDYLAPAFYLTAPIDDISQNCIYINPKSNYTKMKLFTTLAHEGYPGHLYQTVMTSTYGIPTVRSILNYPGYTEGWATYVEMQSYHYAGLDEDLATLLQLNQSAILSLYSTADFGIHYEGWSPDDTRDFFAKYGFTDPSTIQEIYELIVEEPGHYQKYYIGYLKFLQLQEQARSILKDDYSNARFHEAILRMGPAPFPILEKYLPVYLSAKNQKGTVS